MGWPAVQRAAVGGRPRVGFHELSRLSPAQREALLHRQEADLSSHLDAVRPIIERVRTAGDAALVEFARRFDGADLASSGLRVGEEEFAAAERLVPPDVQEALAFAADSVRRFHEAQKPGAMWLQEMRPGVFAGERTLPIDSVACYVPRGKGSFPSVAIMTAVPAVVAGVPRIAMLTPPGPDGRADPATLLAARLAGLGEVYKCGGAQAVAAVAYGTETVPKLVKVVGPGNLYVAAAKRLLAEVIDPGIPAGPSDSVVLADASANARIAALDLIVESEHGPDSSAFLVTDSRVVAEAAQAAIPEFWAQMGEQRAAFSAAVLGGPNGGIVLAPDLAAAIDFVNDYAPEHLEILSAEPFALLGRIRNAGEVLLGENTPFTLANFVIGPNAVLPTSGAARTVSPLSVHDFMKRSNIGYVTAEGYPLLATQARRLALYEGFDGHANAVSPTRSSALAREQ